MNITAKGLTDKIYINQFLKVFSASFIPQLESPRYQKIRFVH